AGQDSAEGLVDIRSHGLEIERQDVPSRGEDDKVRPQQVPASPQSRGIGVQAHILEICLWIVRFIVAQFPVVIGRNVRGKKFESVSETDAEKRESRRFSVVAVPPQVAAGETSDGETCKYEQEQQQPEQEMRMGHHGPQCTSRLGGRRDRRIWSSFFREIET